LRDEAARLTVSTEAVTPAQASVAAFLFHLLLKTKSIEC
jgi:hypothetical protein